MYFCAIIMKGKVATIGYFDGVHLGHQCLIRQVLDEAFARGCDSLLVTFDRHPRAVVHADYVPQVLNSTEEKVALLHSTGVDKVQVLRFDLAMSRMSALEFMCVVLRQQLGVSVLVMGYDHRFGHGGGSLQEYVSWGAEVGIEVVVAHELKGEHVSSSLCRKALMEGRVHDAERMLGYAYSLTGSVVSGHQVGRRLGFPTANLSVCDGKLIPACGVYAVWVCLQDDVRVPGMLNIGVRPTLDNGDERSIEVNLLDFEGDLYGRQLTLQFVERLRDEHRFLNTEELRHQLEVDEARVRAVLKH